MAREISPQARFWQWFQANGGRLQASMYGEGHDAREEAAEELRQASANVQEGLVLEIGSSPSSEIAQLVISAEGNRELFDAVMDFVASAPQMPGWEVVAFRPRMNIHDSIVIRIENEEVSPEDVWFRIEENPDGLDLILYVRGLTTQNERIRGLGAMLMAEHAVGERDNMTLLTSLDVAPLPDEPTAEGLRPFRNLIAVFDKVKEKRYPPAGALPIDQAGWQLLEGTMNGAPVMALLNLALSQIAGHPSYDQRLTITIPYQARGDGMPASSDELDAVLQFSSSLSDQLQQDQQSLPAITLTTQGRRDVVLYTHDADAALRRLEEARATAARPFQTDVERDTFWGMYRTFLHSAQEAEEADEQDEQGEQ